MKIFCVRHGKTIEVVNNHHQNKASKLAKEGIREIKQISKILRKERFHFFFSSPLVRATQTADIIVEEIDLDYEILPLLKEFEYAPEKIQEDEEKKRHFYRELEKNFYNMGWSFEGHESVRDLTERVKTVISLFLGCDENSNILLVSHQLFISCLASYCLIGEDSPPEKFMRLFTSLSLGHGSLSILEYKRNKFSQKESQSWRLKAWNLK